MAANLGSRQPFDVTWDDVTPAIRPKTWQQRLVRTLIRVLVSFAVLFCVLFWSLRQVWVREENLQVEAKKTHPMFYFPFPAQPAASTPEKREDPELSLDKQMVCKKLRGWKQKTALQIGKPTTQNCASIKN